jgi:hypothetical protein
VKLHEATACNVRRPVQLSTTVPSGSPCNLSTVSAGCCRYGYLDHSSVRRVAVRTFVGSPGLRSLSTSGRDLRPRSNLHVILLALSRLRPPLAGGCTVPRTQHPKATAA